MFFPCNPLYYVSPELTIDVWLSSTDFIRPLSTDFDIHQPIQTFINWFHPTFINWFELLSTDFIQPLSTDSNFHQPISSDLYQQILTFIYRFKLSSTDFIQPLSTDFDFHQPIFLQPISTSYLQQLIICVFCCCCLISTFLITKNHTSTQRHEIPRMLPFRNCF